MAIDPNRKRPAQARRSLRSRSSRQGSRRLSSGQSPREVRRRASNQDVGRLELLILRLRVMFGTVITAELALRQQGAERDVEIADCLRAGVSESLGRAIEQLAVLGRRGKRITAEAEPRSRSQGRTGTSRSQRARRRGALH